MRDKSKKNLSIALKIFIIICVYSFVVFKLLTAPDIEKISSFFKDIQTDKIAILLLIIILMPINWVIEIIKWQYLVKKTEYIKFKDCLKAVVTGVTVGTITPNRVGEFCGRILFVSEQNRITASYLTIFGNISQFVSTLIFGIVGITALSYKCFNYTNANTLISASIVFLIISIILYFKFDSIIIKLRNQKKIKKYFSKFIPQCPINTKSKLLTLSFSVLRYCIFCFQFYLAFLFFDIDIKFTDALFAIFSTYICTHIIPNIAAAELGIRTSFAIIFTGLFTNMHTSIVFASLLIYIINIVTPIIIGTYFLVRKK